MSNVHIDPDKARSLIIFLGQQHEEKLTLMEMLNAPERYSSAWKEVYFLLTNERLETKSERKFGEMIDRYMSRSL